MSEPGGPCQVGFRRRLTSNDVGQSISVLPVAGPSTLTALPTGEVEHTRFADVTDADLQKRAKPFVPKNTIKKNKWAYNLFQRWRKEFLQTGKNRNGDKTEIYDLLADDQRDVADYSSKELNVILRAFVIALRKEDGSEYKGESILAIMCGIQRYINSFGHSLDFFKDDEFQTLKVAIGTTMQSKCALGIGLQRRQALVITEDNEAILWKKGILGADTPQSLLDTVFWIIGMHFGLRGGDEHRKLSFQNIAINIDSEGLTYLQYTESVSKTFRGGLKHRNIEPHTARAYENKTNPDRCAVTLFRTYQKHLHPTRNPDLFYFRPLQKSKSEIWFSQNAIGHNTLEGTVKRLMKQAGVPGYFTATRLFRAGVSEQVIREQTEHRSVAVEAYKRTSDVQKRAVSDILHGEPSGKVSKSEYSDNVQKGDSGSVNAGSATYFQCQTVNINISTSLR